MEIRCDITYVPDFDTLLMGKLRLKMTTIPQSLIS